MKPLITLIVFLVVNISIISAEEFTVCSYNCGGLTSHYDYLRAAAMQKLSQERHNDQPDIMALNERVQQVALRILFGQGEESQKASNYWKKNNYDDLLNRLTSDPTDANSINYHWNRQSAEIMTDYRTRPVVIHDAEVTQMLQDHIADITRGKEGSFQELLTETRAIMAERIFRHQLKYDIICLQEADYLTPTSLPEHYGTAFSETAHSVNGIAWNTERFENLETIGSIVGRAFVVKLLDKTTGKTVLIASAHLTGCNPYAVQNNDADKGNKELQAVVQVLQDNQADIKIIAMDSNVTATHPRLQILTANGYQLDAFSFLESTCTSPYTLLDTRIDWIALNGAEATVSNIPVKGVGLNSIQTNMSDHKPIAAKIRY